MLKQNPFFGVGYGMYRDQLAQTAHNTFILAASELGFIGLFCFMGLFYTSFKGMSIIQEKDKDLSTYAVGLQSSLIGFCAAGCFLSRTYVILPYMLFALCGALMDIAHKRNNSIDFKSLKRKSLKRCML